MQRYQVRTKEKTWDVPGPDLLRTRPNAIIQAVDLLKIKGPWYWRKLRPDGEWFEWRLIGDREEVAVWLKDSLQGLDDGQLSQLGRKVKLGKGNGDIEPEVVLRGRNVPIPDLVSATPRAEMTHGLVRARFPDIRFAGCFVCKRYNDSQDPSVGFSDHAWGDAVDETENQAAGIRNDDVTDWCVRMAREDLIPIEQIIGSVNGVVTTFEAPGFGAVRGGPSSHTWHVHISCVQHTGTPPCAGG
jgi:hypothetical protein